MKHFFIQALHYLLLISEVEEVEIFKICLEYWNSLTADLYRESPYYSGSSQLFMSRPLGQTPGGTAGAPNPSPANPQQRKLFYQPVLTKVRQDSPIVILKPETPYKV